MTRAAKAHQALIFRSAGWRIQQIADEMRISRSYAGALITDPDGAKDAARKASYGQPCRKCGKKTTGADGRAAAPEICVECDRIERHETRRWNRAEIIRVIRVFHAEMQRPPSAMDAFGLSPSWSKKLSATRKREIHEIRSKGLLVPHPGLVEREFGSWNAGLEAAGFKPNGSGAPTHREPRERKSHCKYGHPLSGDNLYLYKGGRQCRACLRRRSREYQQRQRSRNE